jgi:FkbM family methyltransferase
MNAVQASATICQRSTALVFLKSLELLQPDVICDIGSRNGNGARTFRSVAPEARIVAVEANPELVGKMRQDEELRKRRIEVLHYAVSNAEGTAAFHVANAELGNGSLKEWAHLETLRRFTVPTQRLDNIIAKREGQTLALWIDCEGCGYEVLDGAMNVLDSVASMHIEVETVQRWQGGKLCQDIVNFMEDRGFYIAHVVVERHTGQGDIVFINKKARLHRAELCAKIARHSALENLARLANAARLKQRMPRVHDCVKRTIGDFLRK